MSIFDKATHDIFFHEDFLETCMIGSDSYKCICTAMDSGISYSDVGLVDEEAFTLRLALPLQKMPKKGDKVKFRDKNYLVADTETDSANTSISIHLQSTSKG